MSAVLLDVNVLLTLLWPAHESHAAVQEWFARRASRAWATCPFTQAGFVRIASNPAFSRDAVSTQEAARLLQSNLRHRGHHFWPDRLGLVDAIEPFRARVVGHRQVTDAYLLGLAIHFGGRLATLDQAVLALLPEDSPERRRVEIIGADAAVRPPTS